MYLQLQAIKTRLAVIAALAACLALLATSMSSSANASQATNIDHHRINRLQHGTSSNWAGYAAFGRSGSFSNVSASWVQPAVTCTSTDSYASFWVGLDGYNTSTVEQLGTDSDCVGGQPTYYAWYEMYPNWAYYARLTVKPGDSLTASVTYTGRNSYQLKIADNTTGKSFATNQRLNALRASAEVVAEAPWNGTTLPLSNFGAVNFTNATANGNPLGSFTNLDPITMNNPAGMTATPSSFDSTKRNFSVTWSAN